MVPPLPPTHAVVALIALTEYNVLVEPLTYSTHVVPPSVVLKIVPDEPTNQPV